jgi:NADPH-dependent curcumin reductase CurA
LRPTAVEGFEQLAMAINTLFDDTNTGKLVFKTAT